MRKVRSSTTTNCSGFSIEPAFICVVAKPPMLTARSSDHLTSLALDTGRPEWKVAPGRSLKVTLMPSGAICPAFRQFRLQLRQIVAHRAVGQGGALEPHEPVVAVERHPVHRLGGADPLHVQAVRPVFLHDQQRLGPGRRLRERRANGRGSAGRGEEGAAIHALLSWK